MKILIVPISRVHYGGGEKIRNAVMEYVNEDLRVIILARKNIHQQIKFNWGSSLEAITFGMFLRRHLISRGPKCMLLFGHNMILVILSKIFNIQIVLCIRKDYEMLSRMLSFRLCSKLADKIVVQHSYTGLKGPKVSIIHNFVQLFDAPSKKKSSTPFRNFGIVGRLDANKNHRFAINSICKYSHSAKVIVFGEGPLYESLSNEYKNANRVVFKGLENSREAIYSSIDILVLASLNEGLPNVLIEALSFGVPIVFSKFSGNGWKEFDLKGWCYPFNPNDGKSLAEAISLASRDEQKRSVKNLHDFLSKFDYNNVMNSWQKLLG